MCKKGSPSLLLSPTVNQRPGQKHGPDRKCGLGLGAEFYPGPGGPLIVQNAAESPEVWSTSLTTSSRYSRWVCLF
jgi:hypothetical protein